MDNVDIAQHQQEIMLAHQLANVHATPQPDSNNKNCNGDYECIDCEELVEPQRVRLGLTARCISCQQEFERKG